MGRDRWQRALAALDAMRRDGRIPATFEVIYGHAWKVAPTRTPEGHAIVRFGARRPRPTQPRRDPPRGWLPKPELL